MDLDGLARAFADLRREKEEETHFANMYLEMCVHLAQEFSKTKDEEEKPSTNDMSASEICRYFNEKVPTATKHACLRSLILRTSVVPDLDDLYWKNHEDGVHQELWIGDDWFNWSEERHLECGYVTERKKILWTETGVSKGQGRSQAKSTNPEVLEAIYLLTQGHCGRCNLESWLKKQNLEPEKETQVKNHLEGLIGTDAKFRTEPKQDRELKETHQTFMKIAVRFLGKSHTTWDGNSATIEFPNGEKWDLGGPSDWGN